MLCAIKSLRLLCLGGMLLGSIALIGCQSQDMPRMPWQRDSSPPPVELLDDTPQQYSASQGSESQQSTAQSSGLAVSSEQRFSDVPLPEGVRADLDRSYIYEDSELEIGRMVYTSRASVNDLAQFYIRECQAAGWNLDRVLQAEGANLHFSRPGKRLEVHVRSLGVGRSQELVLHLTPDRRGMN